MIKAFMNFINRTILLLRSNHALNVLSWTLLFYALMVCVFLFLVRSDLSTAPQFIYSEF